MPAKRSSAVLAATGALAAAVGIGAAMGAGVAPAARAARTRHVVKGGSYSGALAAPRASITVRFKVARNGRKVTGLKTSNLPFYCPGGGAPVPITFKDAPISKAGTFTSTGTQIITSGPKRGQKGATLRITGRFLAGRRESGTITTRFPPSTGSSCNGSSRYATKA